MRNLWLVAILLLFAGLASAQNLRLVGQVEVKDRGPTTLVAPDEFVLVKEKLRWGPPEDRTADALDIAILELEEVTLRELTISMAPLHQKAAELFIDGRAIQEGSGKFDALVKSPT